MNRLEFKDRFTRGLLYVVYYNHGVAEHNYSYDSLNKCVCYEDSRLRAVYTVDDLWYNCLVEDKHWAYFYYSDVMTDKRSLRC